MQKKEITTYFGNNFEPFYSKYCELKRSGREFKAVCPSHDDHTPSLNINPTNGLYWCPVCGAKGDIFTFYGKRHGITGFSEILSGIAADFGIPTNGAKPETPGKLVERYHYPNHDGEILYCKNRFEPKRFSISRPNGDGGYISGMGGIEPVLYNLPAVMEADEVWGVEGEKDADNLNEIGFTATTNFDGAGKWRDGYSQSLKGKDVVLIPDDDEPGHAHMQMVAKSLHGVAASVKIIRLPNPTGIKGYDVSDFITEISDKAKVAERLFEMADSAEPYHPSDTDDPAPPASIKSAILESGEFLSKKMPEKIVYLSPWLSALSIILITGARGIGKSWFLLALLLSIVRKFAFGPWDVENSVPCMFLDGEMAAQDMQERLNALDPAGYRQSPLYIYSDAYASSQGLPRANLLDPEWRNVMKDLLLELGVKVWAVDNIASLTPGIDENSKQQWDPINQWLLELRFNEITTILAHHTNRSGGQRGTSGREDNIDISILLKQPEGYTAEDGASFIASFTKARIAIPQLSKIADTSFRMQQEPDGRTVWTWGSVKQQRNQQIIEMHLDGISNKDIAAELGCTKQNVGQVIRRYETSQN